MRQQSKRVFVSGCFDMLHSGHVQFLQTAAEYGDLFVSVGSDETIRELKGSLPLYSEHERLQLVKALACVQDAAIAGGAGLLDFSEELERIGPDVFVVNEDGDYPEKRLLCRSLGTEYVVLPRIQAAGLPARSSTALRELAAIPYRIDLAGGWLDQPFVSDHAAGPVVVASISGGHRFPCRTGMATSTRKTAEDVWGPRLPPGDPEKLAKILFACENPPGTNEFSGSQDALGILLPGVSRLYYSAEYWPQRIDNLCNEATLSWLEELVCLKPLGPRPEGFCVLGDTSITVAKAAELAEAAEACWGAILRQDERALGDAMLRSFQAQVSMFPRMVDRRIEAIAESFRPRSLGMKLTGAGGGGYLMMVSQEPIEGCLRVKIRRPGGVGEERQEAGGTTGDMVDRPRKHGELLAGPGIHKKPRGDVNGAPHNATWGSNDESAAE